MPRAQTDPTVPTAQDAQLALAASRALAGHQADDKSLRLQVSEDGHELTTLELPAPAAALLMTILKEMGEGHAVALIPIDAEITTQQAADLLNVSRPYVVGLIDKGVLPARMVGNQRRLPLNEVLEHRKAVKAQAYAALKEMAAIDQELGLR
jgi:excisionase family DNA binding protein